MKITLISPSPESLKAMSAFLQRSDAFRTISSHESGIGKMRAFAEQERPDILIVDDLCHDQSELAPIEFISTSYPQMTIIILSKKPTPEFLLQAMRAGVREVLSSPATKEELETAVARAEAKLGLRSNRHSARLLAFISSKGGSGATILSTNLAYQLAAEGNKVLLLDLNLQFGEAVMTVHDRKAGSDIAEVVRNLARLDASLLQASTVPVTSNFSILAAPEDPADSLQIKPEHLDALLNVAVSQYDFLIMDMNNSFDNLSIKALDRAHKIFLVTQPSLPFIHNAKRMMNLFASLGYEKDKIELVVNRFSKTSEIGLGDLRASLPSTKMHLIPNGYKEISNAVSQGLPLVTVSRSSLVVKALNDLAHSLFRKNDEGQATLLSRILHH